MSERIKLNVGGTRFETTRETLEQIPYFKAELTRWKQEEIFVDRSGVAFDHVLNLIRHPEYHYPRRYQYELDFYCIDYNFPQHDIMNEITELKHMISDIYRRMEPGNVNVDNYTETYDNIKCIDCHAARRCELCDKCNGCCECECIGCCYHCTYHITCHLCNKCSECDECCCLREGCYTQRECGQCGRCKKHCVGHRRS